MNYLVAQHYTQRITEIPDELYKIIVQYLGTICYIVDDKWDLIYTSKDLKITNFYSKGQILQNWWFQENEKATAFGSHVVKQGEINTWKITMVENKQNKTLEAYPNQTAETFIGVVYNLPKFLKKHRSSDCWCNIGYQMESFDYYTDPMDRFIGWTDKNEEVNFDSYFKEAGDVIWITLNLQDYTLSFHENMEDEPTIIWRDIVKEDYRLALTIDSIYMGTISNVTIKLN